MSPVPSAGKRAIKSRFVLLLIDEKVANLIRNRNLENQSNPEIALDTQLKTALNLKHGRCSLMRIHIIEILYEFRSLRDQVNSL